MPIRFQCSSCGAGFKADDAQAGQQLPCPKCGSTIQVPLAQATLAPPGDPLDDTESAALSETKVDPLAGIAKKIATQKGGASPPPPPPPTAPSMPKEAVPPNAYQSPQAPTGPPREVDLTNVKITEIDLSFWTIFKLTFRFWIVGLLMGLVMWIVLLAIGFALGLGVAAFSP